MSDKRISESGVRHGVTDKTGALIYPVEPDKAVKFDETVAAAIKNGMAGVIDVDGSEVIPFEYKKTAVGNGVVICLKDNQVCLFGCSANALNSNKRGKTNRSISCLKFRAGDVCSVASTSLFPATVKNNRWLMLKKVDILTLWKRA